jgi:hypothetical protein
MFSFHIPLLSTKQIYIYIYTHTRLLTIALIFLHIHTMWHTHMYILKSFEGHQMYQIICLLILKHSEQDVLWNTNAPAQGKFQRWPSLWKPKVKMSKFTVPILSCHKEHPYEIQKSYHLSFKIYSLPRRSGLE